MEKRVKGVTIVPHNCRIQDKDDAFYMQFNIVVCGLDSVEARRWINSTLVNMFDMGDSDSLKPLIDGGTEGIEDSSGSLGNDANDLIRIQRPISCHLPNVDFML